MGSLLLAAAAPAAEPHVIAEGVRLGVILLSIAVGVALLAKLIKAPYTISLVIAGLAVALLGQAPSGARITHDLVLLLFLPPLLFQAGLDLHLEQLRKVWAPVLILAFPGVVLTSFAVGAAAKPWLAEALGAEAATWEMALLFGVLLAPTDPISVVATFRQAGAPEKLKTVVEGESLFNDGTAVAIFALFRSAVVAGIAGAHGAGGGAGAEASAEAITLWSAASQFLFVAGAGTVLGLALGLAAYWLIRILDDPTLETAVTIALAWGAFVLAEEIHASGVIAVVVAALLIGNGGALHMSERTQTTLGGFWESLDFVVNSVLFLLIGFELSDPAVGGVRRLVEPTVLLAAGSAFVALLAARAAVVYPVSLALKSHWPAGWKHVIAWSGLKGGLSLALVLGLPAGELRQFLAPVVFLVVLASLLIQGGTVAPLMRAVGVRADGTGRGSTPTAG